MASNLSIRLSRTRRQEGFQICGFNLPFTLGILESSQLSRRCRSDSLLTNGWTKFFFFSITRKTDKWVGKNYFDTKRRVFWRWNHLNSFANLWDCPVFSDFFFFLKNHLFIKIIFYFAFFLNFETPRRFNFIIFSLRDHFGETRGDESFLVVWFTTWMEERRTGRKRQNVSK